MKFILLLILICLFVPFSPKMPTSSLDSSWAIGLNQAVSQGFSFGKEIIFTLGPYSFLYTKAYHPATDTLMIIGSLYLALSYWFALIFLMKEFKVNRPTFNWPWTLAFCVLFLGMIYSLDSLFFSYPLLVGLIGFRLKSPALVHFLLFAPFGLLCLIKGSILILCVTVSFLCLIFFIINNRITLAAISIISPLISTLLFWCAIGQSPSNLPLYFINMISIASGFTEAMSTDGDTKEILIYLANMTLLLLVLAWQKQISRTEKLFLACIFFVFLLISFKTGFTRHYGHAFIPGTSILIAALFLSCIGSEGRCTIHPLIVFSFITWYYINNHYTGLSVYTHFMSTYSSAWHGLKNRLKDSNWLKQDYELSMNFLNQQADFPIFQGTTDIYSYQQTYLIASKNNWLPRPVFQSYSVFSPMLAEKNKKHLQSTYSPEHIIFKIEPIDGRVPSLEDGSSWPLLLANYQPMAQKNNFLFLQKKKIAHRTIKPLRQLTSEKHALGEIVHLPDQDQPLFAEIEIKPTFWGYLTTVFFKPNPLYITFILTNGSIKHYRLIANMAKSGFLISPLIENTNEFQSLYGKTDELLEKKVRSFRITTNQKKQWQWDHEYTIYLHTQHTRI